MKERTWYRPGASEKLRSASEYALQVLAESKQRLDEACLARWTRGVPRRCQGMGKGARSVTAQLSVQVFPLGMTGQHVMRRMVDESQALGIGDARLTKMPRQ